MTSSAQSRTTQVDDMNSLVLRYMAQDDLALGERVSLKTYGKQPLYLAANVILDEIQKELGISRDTLKNRLVIPIPQRGYTESVYTICLLFRLFNEQRIWVMNIPQEHFGNSIKDSQLEPQGTRFYRETIKKHGVITSQTYIRIYHWMVDYNFIVFFNSLFIDGKRILALENPRFYTDEFNLLPPSQRALEFKETMEEQQSQLAPTETQYISFTRLKVIPKEIGLFRHLKWLSFAHNHISELPPFLFDITTLIWMELTCNLIQDIPDDVSKLTNLQELYFKGNRVQSMGPLMKVPKLRKVCLRYNQIPYLPLQLITLTCLTKLDIRNNPIETIPDELTTKLPLLRLVY